MHPSRWLWAFAALAATPAAAAEVVTTPRQFEVDIVFPHNITYKPAYLPGDGAMIFNAQTAGWRGEIHDVQQDSIPECPEFRGLVQIGSSGPNATAPACPGLGILERSQGGARPCAVKVDQAAASSISSRVSSSVSSSMFRYFPAPTATTADAVVTSSGSKAGVGPARTVQTALAAPCLVCGLAL